MLLVNCLAKFTTHTTFIKITLSYSKRDTRPILHMLATTLVLLTWETTLLTLLIISKASSLVTMLITSMALM
ncbi:hypothetical protein BD408DRAFT_424699 [Parasitella parasitica]|nr:hypothetical protein BD408DRAFT_424699 [Parasitella parasitica]